MIEGLLPIDKPRGITSHDAVVLVRRALGTRKVGHAGTLDPLATGLLLVGVGRATRLLRYLGSLEKVYTGVGRLGEQTDTLDADGYLTATASVRAEREDVERAAAEMVGEREQVPPAYSAVKVGGVPLHRAARRGERRVAPPRRIVVSRFQVTGFDGRDVAFSVTCSGGTYVRVLVDELGRRLGCGAHLRELRRLRIGPFSVEGARPPDDPGRPRPVEAAVAHLPRVDLDEMEAAAARNGALLGPAGIDGPYGVYGPDGRLIGIYRDAGPRARPETILVRAATPPRARAPVEGNGSDRLRAE